MDPNKNISEYATYISKNMVDPSFIILAHRPLFATSNVGLSEQLEYLDEEYVQKVNMGELSTHSIHAFQVQVSTILGEIANRN